MSNRGALNAPLVIFKADVALPKAARRITEQSVGSLDKALIRQRENYANIRDEYLSLCKITQSSLVNATESC